jgi:hypothetical protein
MWRRSPSRAQCTTTSIDDPERPVHRPDDAAACWERALAWVG